MPIAAMKSAIAPNVRNVFAPARSVQRVKLRSRNIGSVSSDRIGTAGSMSRSSRRSVGSIADSASADERAGADVEIHRRAELLAVRHVQVRPHLVLEELVVRRGDDADDLQDDRLGRLPFRELDELPDRILGAEELARERLVDDGDPRAGR